MHAILPPLKVDSSARRSPSLVHAQAGVRQPLFDCTESDDVLRVRVFVPGVDAAGVEITVAGTDLFVTARKSHVVRVNWQSMHLESAQKDYELRLRLGAAYDYDALRAEIHEGVLTLELPRRGLGGVPAVTRSPARGRARRAA